MTVADRSRLVDCTTWSGDSAGTDGSLLANIGRPSRSSAGEEVLVLDGRAELTPHQIVDEKLRVALHTSRDMHHLDVETAELPANIVRRLPNVLKDCEFCDRPQTGVFARQSFGIRFAKGDSHAE